MKFNFTNFIKDTAQSIIISKLLAYLETTEILTGKKLLVVEKKEDQNENN